MRTAIPIQGTLFEIQTDETGKPVSRMGIYLPNVDKPIYTFTRVELHGLTGNDTEIIIEGDLKQVEYLKK